MRLYVCLRLLCTSVMSERAACCLSEGHFIFLYLMLFCSEKRVLICSSFFAHLPRIGPDGGGGGGASETTSNHARAGARGGARMPQGFKEPPGAQTESRT